MTTHRNDLLPYIEIMPSTAPEYSIIWLHGLGADGTDFVPIVPELNLPRNHRIRFVFPHAPVMPITINNGYEMRAWFDIYDLNNMTKIDTKGISRSIATVEQLIQHETSLGIPSSNVILAGFSQGAVIALYAGLQHANRLAGVIALSGFLPLPEHAFANAAEANRQLPIFLAHGTEDAIVPYALGKAAYAALHQERYPVTWHSYPMQHALCNQEIHDISAWLQRTLCC